MHTSVLSYRVYETLKNNAFQCNRIEDEELWWSYFDSETVDGSSFKVFIKGPQKKESLSDLCNKFVEQGMSEGIMEVFNDPMNVGEKLYSKLMDHQNDFDRCINMAYGNKDDDWLFHQYFKFAKLTDTTFARFALGSQEPSDLLRLCMKLIKRGISRDILKVFNKNYDTLACLRQQETILRKTAKDTKVAIAYLECKMSDHKDQKSSFKKYKVILEEELAARSITVNKLKEDKADLEKELITHSVALHNLKEDKAELEEQVKSLEYNKDLSINMIKKYIDSNKALTLERDNLKKAFEIDYVKNIVVDKRAYDLLVKEHLDGINQIKHYKEVLNTIYAMANITQSA